MNVSEIASYVAAFVVAMNMFLLFFQSWFHMAAWAAGIKKPYADADPSGRQLIAFTTVWAFGLVVGVAFSLHIAFAIVAGWSA